MTITVREISHRADGSEIVRTNRLEAREASIGRAETADITLQDLAVWLQHANIAVSEAGQVLVTGTKGAAFEYRGRKTASAAFDLDRPVDLRFGDHLITVEPGVDPGEATLTVRAVEGTVAAGAAKTFSLASGMFDKRAVAWLLAALVLLISIAAPILFFGEEKTILARSDAQWSTGHLSQSHAFLEDDCESCHQQAFVAVRDSACMACHDVDRDAAEITRVSNEVSAGGSPHPPTFMREHADHERLVAAAPGPDDMVGQLRAMVRDTFNRRDDRCASCHLEHQGPLPVEGEATRISTLPETPTLRPINDCTGCHSMLSTRLADTELGDAPAFDKHPEFKPVVTVSTAGGQVRTIKAVMTSPVRENTGLVFPHGLHLSAQGGVAQMAIRLPNYDGPLGCADCHRPLQNGPGFSPVEMERDCESCHSLAFGDEETGVARLPHGEPDEVIAAIRGYYLGPRAVPLATRQDRQRPGVSPDADRRSEQITARRPDPVRAAEVIDTAFSPGGVCFDCHVVTPMEAEDAPAPFEITPVRLTNRFLMRGTFDHRTPGHLPSTPGGPPCATCHAAETSALASDLLLPAIETCTDCHGAPAESVRHAAPDDCTTCHSFHAPALPTRSLQVPAVVALAPLRTP